MTDDGGQPSNRPVAVPPEDLVGQSTSTEDVGPGVLGPMQIVSVQQSELHVGPLPPPATLKGYDDVLPGAAERILSMAEKLSDSHIEQARALERQSDQMIAAASRNSLLALVVPVVLFLIVVAIILFLVVTGRMSGGFAAGSLLTTLLAGTGATVFRKGGSSGT